VKKLLLAVLVVAIFLSCTACGTLKTESIRQAFFAAEYVVVLEPTDIEKHYSLTEGYDVVASVFTKGAWKSVTILSFSSANELKKVLYENPDFTALLGTIVGGKNADEIYAEGVKLGRVNGECIIIVNTPPLTDQHRQFIEDSYNVFKNA